MPMIDLTFLRDNTIVYLHALEPAATSSS